MKMKCILISVILSFLIPAISVSAAGNTAAVQIMAIPGDGMIVLGDVTFNIASDAHFFAADERTSISVTSFKEGDWVEFSVNSDGEIDEMWLSSEK